MWQVLLTICRWLLLFGTSPRRFQISKTRQRTFFFPKVLVQQARDHDIDQFSLVSKHYVIFCHFSFLSLFLTVPSGLIGGMIRGERGSIRVLSNPPSPRCLAFAIG